MKWLSKKLGWAIFLLLAGAFLLLKNLGVFGQWGDGIWGGLFAAAGLGFLIWLLFNFQSGWRAIPGFTLLSVGALLLLQWQRIDIGQWDAALVLFGIALGFWAMLLVQKQNWWAAIPAGVLIVVGVLLGLQARLSELGWLALVYEPPPAPVYVEPTAPVYEQPTAGYTDTSSGNNGSSGSYGSSGGSTDSGGYGSGGYGSSGGGGSSNSGGSSTIAPSCSLTAAPRCDGNAVLSCQDIGGGMVAEHRQVCPLGCKNAACVYAYQLCKARFAGSGSCPSECDRSYSVSVNGNSYCTSSCGPGGECPAGTACTSDGTCLPPCSVPGDCPTGFLPYCGSSGFCGGI